MAQRRSVGVAFAYAAALSPGVRANCWDLAEAAGLEFTAKPQLAIGQLKRLTAAGLPARWVAAGEVCGRSGGLRRACEQAGLAYVLIIPCDHQVITAAGAVTRADQAAADAVFERRSCGTGSTGPRASDWAPM